MYKTSDYHFDLPNELIAQYPLKKRDESRLLIANRVKKVYSDHTFSDIIDQINPNDCLVINDTKVIPARLLSKKKGSGGKIEIFLLRNLSENRWEALTKPSKHAKTGSTLEIEGCNIYIRNENKDSGTKIIEIDYDGNLDSFLNKYGKQPLPPYIKRPSNSEDKERYQTVYAKVKGAVAAPTAGFHFTDSILDRLREKSVCIAPVTLHVGLGTFRPVKSDFIKEHQMHAEYYNMSSKSMKIIQKAKKNSNRIICVGTTSMRTLESVFLQNGKVKSLSGWTKKFIYPGYSFKIADALVTNFHTPSSTLLMLVSAFAGYHFTKELYQHAVNEKYRFFSYGDSMFIQ